MLRIPTIKTIKQRFPQLTAEQAKSIRCLLEHYADKYPLGTVTPVHTFGKISDILGYHGGEYIPRGHNQKSPPIAYVNTGDTYGTTFIWTPGSIFIGNWGDIVERGNYD